MTPTPMFATGVDPDLVRLMRDVVADLSASDVDVQFEAHDPGRWETLDSLGLTRLTANEASGGSGAGWRESAALLATAAEFGLGVPLVEHDLLAGWLREVAGLNPTVELSTACRVRSGRGAVAVPWVRSCSRMVVLSEQDGRWQVSDVPVRAVSLVSRSRPGSEARDLAQLDQCGMAGRTVPAETAHEFLLRGALARSIQTCSAMNSAVTSSVEHVHEREQFGRRLSKFQVVQHLVAEAAAESALAQAATENALTAVVQNGFSDSSSTMAIATARTCVGHAVASVVRTTHQLHGALGTTREHRLRQFTMPALTWRNDYGSVRFWEDTLARAALGRQGSDLWALITDTPDRGSEQTLDLRGAD
ncbi:acyl-CoA dehydrogenase family protein [Aeromicrobium alkaliterrae]|uniref:Acyl-CoA dehydrogenase family protein n=1 Tax=Aeromicrobium alkaliterrae TaxID=302168 RepID=A0ABP4WKW2_9ACTN